MSTSPRRMWLYVTEAIAVLGVLISLGAWLWPQNKPPAPAPLTQPGTVATTSAGGVSAPTGGATSPGATSPAAGTVPLDSLRPDAGAGNLGPLPKDLGTDPAYARALTIHCPTNQNTDQLRAVRYQLLGRWAHLHLTLRAYGPVPDESRVQVEVFLDSVSVGSKALVVGRFADLDATLDGAQKMELRVTCDSPDDTAILAGATLQHA